MPGLLTKMFIRKKRVELIIPEVKKEWSIIDLGCGDMWLTNHLRGRGYNCLGADLKSGDVHCSIGSLPFPDKCFDCAILIEVVEHVDPETLKEVERVTRKKIIVSTHVPNVDWLLKAMIAVGAINQFGTPEKTSYWMKDVPFKSFELKRSSKYYLIDQFGVFEAKGSR